GQTKDAFSKTNSGAWRYDIIMGGFKMNLPDINAAIALAQLKIYDELIVKRRAEIYDLYTERLSVKQNLLLPERTSGNRNSCCHLYPLRITGYTERDRDNLIEKLNGLGISTNVHFIPIPMLSYFKEL